MHASAVRATNDWDIGETETDAFTAAFPVRTP
jgi:hypothetical protein